MNKRLRRSCIYLINVLALITACGVNGPIIKDTERYRKPDSYNLRLVAYDMNIDNPARDRRSYYKVYINKVEAGRTTIGLESQDKYFEAKLPMNRHLITVEKWILDERKGKYVKLNNIEQPRPNYVYFGIPENRIVVITVKNDADKSRAVFEIDYERQ